MQPKQPETTMWCQWFGNAWSKILTHAWKNLVDAGMPRTGGRKAPVENTITTHWYPRRNNTAYLQWRLRCVLTRWDTNSKSCWWYVYNQSSLCDQKRGHMRGDYGLWLWLCRAQTDVLESLGKDNGNLVLKCVSQVQLGGRYCETNKDALVVCQLFLRTTCAWR